MTVPTYYTNDPALDLVIERTIADRPELVWRAWTEPALIKQWFTPRPWETVACEIDLRPGGRFTIQMRSPEGEDIPVNTGCILEAIPNERLAWTGALEPGFRPQSAQFGPDVPLFTALITMEPDGAGTRYRAIVMHRDAEGASTHEAMGFFDSWGTAVDQLVELVSSM